MFQLAAAFEPGQKLDCSRVTRKGHAPSSWARAGGAAPESHLGSQEAGPVPRPLPRRENPVERELATGDLGGEVTWGLGFAGGGGTGGRGSPPESKFPPGENEWGMRMAKSGIRDSESPSLSSLRPRGPGPQPSPAWDLELPNLVQLFPHRDRISRGPQVPPHQELGFQASSFLFPKTQQP